MCPNLTEAKKEKVRSRPVYKGAKTVKEMRLKNERKSREASAQTGVNLTYLLMIKMLRQWSLLTLGLQVVSAAMQVLASNTMWTTCSGKMIWMEWIY